LYVLAALVLIAVVLTTTLASRFSVPLILIALGVGIVFGSDVTGLIWFDNAHLANELASAALVFILFAGGFETKRENLKLSLVPSMTLATVGVVVTAGVTGLLLWLVLGYSLPLALMIGTIVSCTDAAAVFSIFKTRSISKKVAATSELESAANDPMAIIATTLLVAIVAQGGHEGAWWTIGLDFLWKLVGGAGLGFAVGWVAVRLFRLIQRADRGYFYVLLIGVVLLSYGVAELVHASGMLAAFFAGLVLGNSKIPYRQGLETFLDALSTIANIGLFVLLGLLVFPKEFAHVWFQGIVLFLVLTFVARPAAVWLSTLFSGFRWRDKVFLSWAGVRGAVPIVLATYPLAAGIEGGKEIFNLVFFAVGLSVIVQGTTVGPLADWLGLSLKSRPKPRQAMELITFHESELELCELPVDGAPGASVAVSDLGLPPGTTITMINRKEDIVAPRGSTLVIPGDVVYVLVRSADKAAVEAIFARSLLPPQEDTP
jgi:cell volume regulation protein A